MVRLRSGRSGTRPAGDAQDDDQQYADSAYDAPVEAEIVDLDDEPNASDDARAIRAGCEAIVRYIAPYVEHVRGDVPASEAVRLAEARELVEDALDLLA
jgi:hypothetical protein